MWGSLLSRYSVANLDPAWSICATEGSVIASLVPWSSPAPVEVWENLDPDGVTQPSIGVKSLFVFWDSAETNSLFFLPPPIICLKTMNRIRYAINKDPSCRSRQIRIHTVNWENRSGCESRLQHWFELNIFDSTSKLPSFVIYSFKQGCRSFIFHSPINQAVGEESIGHLSFPPPPALPSLPLCFPQLPFFATWFSPQIIYFNLNLDLKILLKFKDFRFW